MRLPIVTARAPIGAPSAMALTITTPAIRTNADRTCRKRSVSYMPRRRLGGGPVGTEEVALQHERHPQRPVADGLEQHRHLIAVIALHGPLAPLRVVHGRADLPRPLAVGRVALAGLAVVAVPARALVLL